MYCEKCRYAGEEKTCPICGNALLREAAEGDMVLFYTAPAEGWKSAELVLTEHAIAYEMQDAPFLRDMPSYEEADVPPAKEFYVRFADLEAAKALLPAITQTAEEMQMPSKKRTVVRLLSVILFIAAIWLVVYAADWVAALVKALFSA